MPETLELKNMMESLVSSYEQRIQSMGSILDATYLIFTEFQESLLDTKQEREKINSQLRDILAKNEFLRKKDFDQMMQGILLVQDRREKEVKNLLNSYFNEQKEMARNLRENLGKFRDFLARGEAQRIKEFQGMIRVVLDKQNKRKEEVTAKLKEFQIKQQEMIKKLKALLAKGKELRIKDLKLMLKEFNILHQERIARQEERGEKVSKMLCEFKKKRLETGRI